MDFTEKMQRLKMGLPDYIQALEDEQRKIQVFSKELPLSLELVTHAIEACRQQLSGTTTEYNLNGHSECSDQTTSTDGPVLEEFIPIKKRTSPDCDEDDEDEQHSHQFKISKDNKNSDKKKSDWLRSVQLWNPEPSSAEEDGNKKVTVVEVKRSGSGGAFQPFHKEERVGKTSESMSKAPSMPNTAVATTSSMAAVEAARDNAGSSKKEDKEGQRKQRRCWSQELHKRFLQALQQLGGADSATPKQIRELMKVDGLTNDEVKSHLQKYRLHTKRPTTPMVHNNANPQTAPFVLVGNIFVQSPEYAAAAVASTSTADLATVAAAVAAPAGIYAPVATHPPSASIRKQQLKKATNHHVSQHSHSEERTNNHSEGTVHSNSPASSSSTHTTTTSPGY